MRRPDIYQIIGFLIFAGIVVWCARSWFPASAVAG